MPAPLAVDREAVKTLCIAIGVGEAARRLGIPENTVRQWSCRGKWFAAPVQPPTVKPKPVGIVSQDGVTTVIKPAQALQEHLEEDSRETRISLSRAARKASEHLSNAPAGEVMDRHKALVSVAQVASKVHGWEESKAGSNMTLNMQLIINPSQE